MRTQHINHGRNRKFCLLMAIAAAAVQALPAQAEAKTKMLTALSVADTAVAMLKT